MKKILVTLMILALAVSALAIPALAEDTAAAATDQTSSATVQTGKGGHGGRQMPGQNNQNGQMPQMPGQGGRNGQMPQMPDQNGQNGQNNQMPQMPNQNSQNGQNNQQAMPGRGGRGMKNGNRNGNAAHGGKEQFFEQMLKDSVITQETYDAIIAYLQKNAPQQPDAAASADGSEPPAAPEGQSEAPEVQPDASTETQPEPPELQILKDMLDNGVITQEQYDQYVTRITPAAPNGST